ncbi:MAG: hypothetical protein M0042_13440 [Nitrospiraceae bacterium]|nr:hypothetical protein [Nitrospiraceae bacterium]
MNTPDSITNLVEEYKTILKPAVKISADYINLDSDKIEDLLVAEGEWTPSAAEHLLRLSKDYGSFMLRNALALSLALEIEDGALGF